MQYDFEVGVRLLFDALHMFYYSSINLGFKIVETGCAVIFIRPGYINPYAVSAFTLSFMPVTTE
jgi:hypothetical protein